MVKKAIRQNTALGPKLSDEEWVALHVPRFKKVQSKYEVYARFLESVLKAACRQLAPLAVVTTRGKTIASFAEKIIRKRKLYTDPKDPQPPDPLVRMADLCAGRVIAQTADQVHALCQFIELAFDIDRPNSEDFSQRLKTTEFGYRSVHYIVQVNPAKLKAAGIAFPVPKVVLGAVRPEGHEPTKLKAEVQVRTLLEHASVDIAHDLIYNADVKVPDRIRRQYAALAAVLEGADRTVGELLASLHEFKSNFGAWHKPNEVKNEINRLRIVLKYDPVNEDLAVRIGQLALAIDEHEIALDVLKPFSASRHQGVQRVRALALTELHWGSPAGGPASPWIAVAPPKPSTAESGYIFISYKREDLPRIVPFMHRIVGWGFPIWYDRGIPGGAEWDSLIEEKVSHCKVLLVFLSEAAVDSKWVRREIKFADSENRPILGIRLDKNVELKHGLKVVMNQYQMIDASGADFSDELRKAMEYARLL